MGARIVMQVAQMHLIGSMVQRTHKKKGSKEWREEISGIKCMNAFINLSITAENVFGLHL